MTERLPQRTYPQGVSSWIDLETGEPEASAAFYGALLGWTLADAMPPQAPGHHLVATVPGLDAAAIASGAAALGPGGAWSTCFAVDDADASALAVERPAARSSPRRATTSAGARRSAPTRRARSSASGRPAAASLPRS